MSQERSRIYANILVQIGFALPSTASVYQIVEYNIIQEYYCAKQVLGMQQKNMKVIVIVQFVVICLFASPNNCIPHLVRCCNTVTN